MAWVLRCWQANPGRGQGAILAGCIRKGWLYEERQREYDRPGTGPKKSPPCAKGGQHGNAMQGGIDSTQLPGRYQVPGVGMVSQVPSIPQSAFADSSLCTREPSLLPSIQPAKFCFPARQRSLGAASRRSPPCAKGGQHGRAMQGGIDSTQLPGRYQVPGVGMVSQVPSIPQSAFADSSLCTREVRWPDGPSAWAVISLLAVLHPTGPFCGTLPGLHPSPFRVMVYHTRSTEAGSAYSLQRVLGAASRCLEGHFLF